MNPGNYSRSGAAQPTLAELKLLTDDQLMVQLKDGVNDALAVLFERYQRLVFSIALKIVRDRGEAEDVTQNVFLEIYRSVAQFDPAKGKLKYGCCNMLIIALSIASGPEYKELL